MPKHHTRPTWTQPALMPPEFVRAEIWVTYHAGSGTASVSHKVYDPDGSELFAMEVVPVTDLDRVEALAQQMCREAVAIARANVPPF